MREHLVKQATNFLCNSGIKSQTLEKKQEFLKSKGLTDEEIEEARKRTEVSVPQAQNDLAAGIAGSELTGLQSTTAASGARSSTLARGSTLQAVLLLQRRLAELEHERACYMEALEALGVQGLRSGAATIPRMQQQVPLPSLAGSSQGPSTTAAHLHEAVQTGDEPVDGGVVPIPSGAYPNPAGSSPTPSSTTAARKPWESTGETANGNSIELEESFSAPKPKL
mmetsp:Transcript_3542/g.6850  ORF Transcript_3542/g.6850 Transcript_3542/m.6850 type:complete len:224 (-) Transcript_3542:52-723(-)|eukprot:CAMPEP_0172813368 /NCGR_PEP_ID=MMETSP1075-20121228/10618_1 /TAXON_ID=2916 /ORGANISM="Ceratium fusus, Strain PA161109" /LENGTH=223 /DNA_ID=CAMNT_0013653057 /DNA_START=45 /DNA_END=716 /DNA_ORIENTATION=+